MRTRCPDCQTVFRVTPDQLKARAGKVRCGHCQSVFNALDTLLDEENTATLAAPAPIPPPVTGFPTEKVLWPEEQDTTASPEEARGSVPEREAEVEEAQEAPLFAESPQATDESNDASATQDIGKAAGLILPRETTEIPGYSKWAEGVVTAPLSLPEEKPSHWPFVLVAALLVLGLAGQVTFHFRSELAVSFPVLRPWLESFSHAFDSPLPLPRHAELVTIETSDLQTDTARGNLLVLNATLRNRAPYGQAYPLLELSLTDVQDAAIARRVFTPKDYLPAKIPADRPFPGNTDVAIRLWIEASEIGAAGYRLFVFYP